MRSSVENPDMQCLQVECPPAPEACENLPAAHATHVLAAAAAHLPAAHIVHTECAPAGAEPARHLQLDRASLPAGAVESSGHGMHSECAALVYAFFGHN